MNQRIPNRNVGNKYPLSAIVKSKIGVGITRTYMTLSDRVKYDTDYQPRNIINPSQANEAWERRHNPEIRVRRKS